MRFISYLTNEHCQEMRNLCSVNYKYKRQKACNRSANYIHIYVFPCFTFSRIHVSKQNSGPPHISHHIIQGFACIFFAICWLLRQHNSKAIKRGKEQAKLISFLQGSCKTQDKTDQSGKIKENFSVIVLLNIFIISDTIMV